MHPAFALARTRLTETRSELDAFLQANEERLTPLEADQDASAVWLREVSRASGIEGVYTGMENVLKEVLTVVDGGVFGQSSSFHMQLLASRCEDRQENRSHRPGTLPNARRASVVPSSRAIELPSRSQGRSSQ